MRTTTLLSLFLLFFANSLFCQTNNFYTISYLDSLDKENIYSGINVTDINANSLSFESIYNKGDNITPIKITKHKINLNKISSFGYRGSTTLGTRIGTGAAIGFGTGLILGGVAGSVKLAESYENHTLEGALVGSIFGGLIGGTVGAFTGIGAKEYETVNLSSYSNQKKAEVIHRLILKGLEINKEEE